MNQPIIPTPAKYQLRRAAGRGLPALFFLSVCATSALLWQFQHGSTVLLGEVEVVEYLVASPQTGIVSQLVPSQGAELGVYVSVAKDQLLVQLDDNLTRKQLELVQDELVNVSNAVGKEVARLNALDSLAMREVAIQLDEEEEQESTDQVVEGDEATIWNETQSLVEQSLKAVAVAQKQLDLRQLDFELDQAVFAQAATGSDPAMLAQFQQQRKKMADEIYELKTTIAEDRIASLASISTNSPVAM